MNYLSHKWLLALVSVLVLTGCQGLGPNWDDERQTLYVDYYKQQCNSDSNQLCFRIRESQNDSWKVVDEPFNGFDSFMWGYRYRIDATVSFDDDGRPERYRFETIRSEEAVSTAEETFSLSLHTGTGVLYALNATQWEMGNDVSFACGAECDGLTAAVANAYVTELQFRVDGQGGIELDSLLCSAADSDFAGDCEGEADVSWYVAPILSECGVAEPRLCLLYKVNSSDDWEILQLDDGISGFNYRWGERAKIGVTSTTSNGGRITAASLKDDDENRDEFFGSAYDGDFHMILRASGLANSSNGEIALYDDIYGNSVNLDCGMQLGCSDIDDAIDAVEDGDVDEYYMVVRIYMETDGDSNGRPVATGYGCERETLSEFRSCLDSNYSSDIAWEI